MPCCLSGTETTRLEQVSSSKTWVEGHRCKLMVSWWCAPALLLTPLVGPPPATSFCKCPAPSLSNHLLSPYPAKGGKWAILPYLTGLKMWGHMSWHVRQNLILTTWTKLVQFLPFDTDLKCLCHCHCKKAQNRCWRFGRWLNLKLHQTTK